HLLAQCFTVEPPAFAERDVAVALAELRADCLAYLDVALHDMARNAFMTHQIGDDGRVTSVAEEVNVDASRPRSVRAGGRGVWRSAGDLAERRLANDLHRVSWQQAEVAGQERPDARDRGIGVAQIVGA